MMHATHVVVDTHDGYTFWRGADGALFTEATAAAFAAERNAEMKPEHALYRVFALAEVPAPEPPAARRPVDPDLYYRKAPAWNCVTDPKGPHYLGDGRRCQWCGEQVPAAAEPRWPKLLFPED